MFIASGFSGDHGRSMAGNGKGFGFMYIHSLLDDTEMVCFDHAISCK